MHTGTAKAGPSLFLPLTFKAMVEAHGDGAVLTCGQRISEVRAFDATARAATKQRSALRKAHGRHLVKHAHEALKTLPSTPSTAVRKQELIEACDAARLALWLGMQKAPQAIETCHSFAARCLTLKHPALAAELSAEVVHSLASEASGDTTAEGPSAPPPELGSPGPWAVPVTRGVESYSSCELAVLALCVHLPALQTLALQASQHGPHDARSHLDALTRAVPTLLGWLERLDELSQKQQHGAADEEAKENRSRWPSSRLHSSAWAALVHGLSVLRGGPSGAGGADMAAWEKAARRLCRKEQRPQPAAANAAAARAEAAAYTAALESIQPVTLAVGVALSAATPTHGPHTPNARGGQASGRRGALPDETACNLGAEHLHRAARMVPGDHTLTLEECCALAEPLQGLYRFYANTLEPLPKRLRGQDADGVGAGGGALMLPLPLLQSVATALDRYVMVIGTQAVLRCAAGKQTSWTQSASNVVRTLIGVASLRFYCDAQADVSDCELSQFEDGTDWVCGVDHRLRCGAAAVCSDVPVWPPDPTTIVAAPVVTLERRAPEPRALEWLLHLSRHAQKLAVRLRNAGHNVRAYALARCAAEIAARAADLHGRLNASIAANAIGAASVATAAPATPTKAAHRDGPARTFGTVENPTRAADTGTHIGGARTGGPVTIGGGGLNGADGLEGALALLCSARYTQGGCLSAHGVASRHSALHALQGALEAWGRLEAIAGSPHSCTETVGGRSTARELGMAAKRPGLDVARSVAKSFREIVSMHAPIRAQLHAEEVATALPAALGGVVPQVAPQLSAVGVLLAVAEHELPATTITSAACIEMCELAAIQPSASPPAVPNAVAFAPLLAGLVGEVANSALAAISASTHPIENARILLMRAETFLRLYEGAIGGGQAGGEATGEMQPAPSPRVDLAEIVCDAQRALALVPWADVSATVGNRVAAHPDFVSSAGNEDARDGGPKAKPLNVKGLKADELRAELERRRLPVIGKKPELALRLQAALDAERLEPAMNTKPAAVAAQAHAPQQLPTGHVARDHVTELQALEVHARARLLLASVALMSSPTTTSEAGTAAVTEVATESAEEASKAAATYKRAAEEAVASLHAFTAVFACTAAACETAVSHSSRVVGMQGTFDAMSPEAEHYDEDAAAEALRNALFDPPGTASAVLRCSWLLWMVMSDEVALEAIDLAARAACLLRTSAESVHCLRATMLQELGLSARARETLILADESGSSCDTVRVVSFDMVAAKDDGQPPRAPAPASASLRAALAALDVAMVRPPTTVGDSIGGVAGGSDGCPVSHGGAAAAEQQLLQLTSQLSRRSKSLEAAQAHVAIARGARARGALSVAMKHAMEAFKLAARVRGTSLADGSCIGRMAGMVVACDALLLLAEMWASRGSLVDAQRYVQQATRLARHTGLPRLRVRVLISQAALHAEACQEVEGASCLDAIDVMLSPFRSSATSRAATAPFLLLELRVADVRAGLYLSSARPKDALEAASAGLAGISAASTALAALASRAGHSNVAKELEAPEEDMAVARDQISLSLRAAAAHRTLGRPAKALETLRVAEKLVEGGYGTIGVAGPPPVAEVYLQLGLCQLDTAGHIEGLLSLWRMPDRSRAGGTDSSALGAARAAFVRALRVEGAALSPATLQRVCIGLASCCGPRHEELGARLLVSSIGAGVRYEVALLQAAALEASGAHALAADSDLGGSGAVETLSRSVASLSLGNELGASGQLETGSKTAQDKHAKGRSKLKGANASAAKTSRAAVSVPVAGCSSSQKGESGGVAQPVLESWAQILSSLPLWSEGGPALHASLDEWMRNPPNGCAIAAVAVGPGGHGLLVGRWRRGAQPAIACVATSAGGKVVDASAMLAELRGLMARARTVALEMGAEGEAARAATVSKDPAVPHPETTNDVASKAPSGAAPSFVAQLVPDFSPASPIVLSRKHPSIALGREQLGLGLVDDEEASAAHCTVTLDPQTGALRVFDTSDRGTYINDRKIAHHSDRVLRDGARLTLARPRKSGGPTFCVKIAPDLAAEAAPETAAKAAATGQNSSRADQNERIQQLWGQRKALDAELGQLCERLQHNVLGPAACLLTPPATSPKELEARDDLSRWAMEHATASKWTVVNEGLLRAAFESTGLLDASLIEAAFDVALATDCGEPLGKATLISFTTAVHKQWEAAAVDVLASAKVTVDEGARRGDGAPCGGRKAAAAAPGPARPSTHSQSTVIGASGDAVQAAAGTHDYGERAPLVLVLDDVCGQLPWESTPMLRDRPVCRLPCAAFLQGYVPPNWRAAPTLCPVLNPALRYTCRVLTPVLCPVIQLTCCLHSCADALKLPRVSMKVVAAVRPAPRKHSTCSTRQETSSRHRRRS